MKPVNVVYTLLITLAVLALAFRMFRNEPVRKEAFDRTPSHLTYTQHALCRMECREISREEILEIMRKGLIHFNKSNRNDKPCPTYALQGRTESGEKLRVIFAQCPTETKVITCYNLEQEFKCDCPPGAGPKNQN
jgi:hypothetical protein